MSRGILLLSKGAQLSDIFKDNKNLPLHWGDRYFQKAATFEGRYLRGAATLGGGCATFRGPLLLEGRYFPGALLSEVQYVFKTVIANVLPQDNLPFAKCYFIIIKKLKH